MINSDNIGKRIRSLRKQRKLSQERLAEELGMYQADISNLERAVNGSGINDLFKLDLIADFFGITLIELLTGANGQTETVSDSKKSEGYELKDYVIEDARRRWEDDLFASEVKLVAPDKRSVYIAFCEYDDVPAFYKSEHSLLELLMQDRNDAIWEELGQYCILQGEDYIDIFRQLDETTLSLGRYLIYAATEEFAWHDKGEEIADIEAMLKESIGLSISNLAAPVPEREPEDLFGVDYSDLAVVYRYRLMVETDLEWPSIYSDMDNIAKQEEVILDKLKLACASEEAYQVWKKDVLDAKVQEIMKKDQFVVCTYLFAGIGQYEAIMPEKMVQSFICWINHNGSAFYGGNRPATEDEIRAYVAQHIMDELP